MKHNTTTVLPHISPLILLAATLASASPDSLSLKDALNTGLKGNLDLKKLEVGTELSLNQVDQAKSSYYPTLKASGSIMNMWDKPVINYMGVEMEQGSRWTVDGGLTLTQPIYIAQAITGVRIANKALKVDALGKKAQKDGVIQQISVLYWTAAYMEENQKILLQSRDNLTRVRETVKSMVDNGVVKQSDLNSMNINIASLDASAEKIKQQVKTQKLALLNAMGRTQSDLFLTDKLSIENRSKADPEGDALKNSTSLRLLEEQVQLKDMQETLAGQSRLPTVVAFAKYQTEGTSEHFDFYENTSDKFTDTGVLGIQVDMPIFDGMSSSNAKSKARIEKRQLQIDIEKKKIAIQADVSNAKTALATARSQVERQIANTKLSEENYQMKELEYKEQVASLSDLLTAESNVLNARSNLAEALYNEKTAELNLEQALGQISQRGEQ